MIIARTPYRISFFGGGTDYPAWYRQEGGAVLSTTIDKYCYLSCRHLPPFFGIRHRIVWSHIETVSSISEILHPAVREGLRMLGFDDGLGLEIQHQGDLPARAGMGSSSAFAVGLIRGLTALRGESIGKRELARQAIALEQDVLKENVGCQDQVAATFGGFNMITFERNGDFRVDRLLRQPRLAELQSRLVLVYSGTSRLSSPVAGDVIGRLTTHRRELQEMRVLVDRALDVLLGQGSLDPFGEMMHRTWTLKRSLSTKAPSPHVDRIYETALANGALGGKLLGAGASGFLVFYVPEHRRASVLQSLADYVCVPFAFESEGSVVIYDGQPQTKRSPEGLSAPVNRG